MKKCLKCKRIYKSSNWTCPDCAFEPEYLNDIPLHSPEFANVSDGFKAQYFSSLVKLEESNFWFEARNSLIFWLINKYKPNSSNFLEVGCGTGFVLSGMSRAFPKVSLLGSEIFLDGLTYASGRVPSAKLLQMDARNIPFSDEFDAIGSFDVLEHIAEDEIALTQMYQAIKPGGVLFLSVPQHPFLWGPSDEYACHVRRYSKMEIEKKITASGFEILRSSSFVSILLPIMMLSRLLQRLTKKKFNPSKEFEINNILNKLFGATMNIELFGLRLGVNYPFGGSRFIVARKN